LSHFSPLSGQNKRAAAPTLQNRELDVSWRKGQSPVCCRKLPYAIIAPNLVQPCGNLRRMISTGTRTISSVSLKSQAQVPGGASSAASAKAARLLAPGQ
jgi:hypothetical protein